MLEVSKLSYLEYFFFIVILLNHYQSHFLFTLNDFIYTATTSFIVANTLWFNYFKPFALCPFPEKLQWPLFNLVFYLVLQDTPSSLIDYTLRRTLKCYSHILFSFFPKIKTIEVFYSIYWSILFKSLKIIILNLLIIHYAYRLNTIYYVNVSCIL